MMKEIKLENMNPLAALENNLWQAMNLLRGFVDAGDFHFVLFLLILQREELLKDIVPSDQDNLKQQLELALQKLDSDTCEHLRAILPLYDRIIKKANTNVVYELIQFLASLDQDVLKEHFAEIFDDLLFRLSKWQGRAAGEFMLPTELSRFACALADLPPHAQVYNPFAGVASFGVLFPGETLYLGQEINFTTWTIGLMRLMAYDKIKSSVFSLNDSTNEWGMQLSPPFDVPRNEDYIKRVNHDLVIASPPFGMRLSKVHNGRFGIIRNYEHFLVEKGIEILKEKGKLIAIISHGFLFRSGTEQNLRQYLVENDLLEMVISFPGGLLINTGIPFAILVINKDKKEKGSVRFIDAKGFVDNKAAREKRLDNVGLSSIVRSNEGSKSVRIVTNSIIGEYYFNLNVPRYFTYEIEIDSNVRLVNLGELVSLIRGQRNIEGQKGKFIRIRDLKDDKLNFELGLNDIEEVEIPKPAQKISESCLLLATRWKTLKPTYFEFHADSIFVIPDTIPLKVDETKIDISYLINELHADYVTKQVESLRIGDTIPSIRREDLLSIKIKLPVYHEQKKYVESIREQKAIVKGAKVAILDERKKESELFKKIHGLEGEIIEQNTYLRHSLAGTSSNLKGSMESLKRIIMEQLLPLVPKALDFKVSSSHTLNFKNYLDIIERDILKISQTTSRATSSFNPVQGRELYPVEIYDFLQDYVMEKLGTPSLAYKLVFQFDEEAFMDENGGIIRTYIMANKDLLTDLLDNLILNAEQHAFPGHNNNRIEICLLINAYENVNTSVTLLISNTGNTFPEDFTFKDYIRNGSTAGDNGGDGYGGWLIYKIVSYLNGELDIIDEKGPEGPPETDLSTSFEITIPIIQIEADETI